MESTITGIVLSGGESQRMGSDKGLLLLNNKKLIEYPVDILRKVCKNIIISANTSSYNYLGFPVVADKYKSAGPISGLFAGLQASKTAHNIILACDMPFVDPGILDILLLNMEKYEIIVPSVDDWPLPVCGYYNKSVLPVLESEINKNNFSLQGILKKCNSLILEIDDEPTRKKLININTREEFMKFAPDSFSRLL